MDDEKLAGILAEKYMAPPLSVLDRRSGRWQKRRKKWAFLPVDTDGRGDGLTWGTSELALEFSKNGTSSFDPFLAELMIAWFCPEKGAIIDPFCGGVTRGAVSACMGRAYTGLDIRSEQTASNKAAWESVRIPPAVLGEYRCRVPIAPEWVCGDCVRELAALPKGTFDFALTSPPFDDCEVYSDLPGDLSNATTPEFDSALRVIFCELFRLLKSGRFAAFNVGNTRGKNGEYRDLHGRTIKAAQAAGFKFWNDLVIVDPIALKGPICERPFRSALKASHSHQYVCIFLKGNAPKYCGFLKS